MARFRVCCDPACRSTRVRWSCSETMLHEVLPQGPRCLSPSSTTCCASMPAQVPWASRVCLLPFLWISRCETRVIAPIGQCYPQISPRPSFSLSPPRSSVLGMNKATERLKELKFRPPARKTRLTCSTRHRGGSLAEACGDCIRRCRGTYGGMVLPAPCAAAQPPDAPAWDELSAASSAPHAPESVVVSVVGEVQQPGLATLPQGSRASRTRSEHAQVLPSADMLAPSTKPRCSPTGRFMSSPKVPPASNSE